MGFSMCCFGSNTGRKPNYSDSRVEAGDSSSKEEESLDVSPVKKYKWEEIEKYTMNFKEVIGIGGYSTVYYACIQSEQYRSLNLLGAIKIYNSSERLHQVFKSELEICQKLNHDNIVKLLGYCDENDEGVLVFEYIPKGNLQEQLHNNNNNNNNVKTQEQLTWKQRMKIAYQLAKALEYLHESCDLQIVHGDIKGSNILLDENLNCMLCDFGFAKMGFSSMIKPPSSSRLTMMGSPGYIDPHFLMTGIASKKSDVYSFGVVLLELVTGLEAFICEGGGENKAVLLTSVFRGKEDFDVEKLVRMIDVRIIEDFDKEEVRFIGEIAARCLHHLPSLRPNASEICKVMQDHVRLDLSEKVNGGGELRK